MDLHSLMEKIIEYGVGHRSLDDRLFAGDKPPARLGIHDIDDDELSLTVIETVCVVPGCKYLAESLSDYQVHYNSKHRYSCSQCKKVLPSPHLLDLHVEETHDSFFAVMAAKKPSYSCFIEECKEKFQNPDVRLKHCIAIHKLPKDYRFDSRPKIPKSFQETTGNSMEVDSKKEFGFTNNKLKAFSSKKGKPTSSKFFVDSEMEEVIDNS